MIRMSVSDLESYRYWKDSDDSEMPDLLRKLRHQDPPTMQMEAGKAFAKVFERLKHDVAETATEDGWTFDFTALDQEINLSPVRELKGEVSLSTPSGPVTLVGKVDGLSGLVVHDQKLTERFDAERYLDSLQWRAYLWMFGATKFVYDVFVGKYEDDVVRIREYHRLAFYTYPKVAEDIQKAVEELAAVIAANAPDLVKEDAP